MSKVFIPSRLEKVTNEICLFNMLKKERKNLKRKRARQADADISDWTSPSSKEKFSLLSEEEKIRYK